MSRDDNLFIKKGLQFKSLAEVEEFIKNVEKEQKNLFVKGKGAKKFEHG